MNITNHSFPKSEHLTNEKTIAELFKSGKVEFLYPFKVMVLFKEGFGSVLPKVLFTVPKKNFKKAVDRNLIRRRAKEIYRLHKNVFLSVPPGKKIPACLGIIYIAKEKVSYSVMEKKFILVLERLTK